MRSSLVLSVVAALAFVASNVQAQEVANYAAGEVAAPVAAPAPVAPATTAAPVITTGECYECEPGFGIGGRFGGLRGAGLRARFDERKSQRAIREGNKLQIVQASPFANPTGEAQDWARFRNYPYGYYPHNFAPSDMRIPGYNPAWQNYYPVGRRYHEGNHFNLDVF